MMSVHMLNLYCILVVPYTCTRMYVHVGLQVYICQLFLSVNEVHEIFGVVHHCVQVSPLVVQIIRDEGHHSQQGLSVGLSSVRSDNKLLPTYMLRGRTD